MVSPTAPIRGSTSCGVREGHVSVFISSILEDPGARYLYKTSVVTEGGRSLRFLAALIPRTSYVTTEDVALGRFPSLAPPLRLVPRPLPPTSEPVSGVSRGSST